MCRRGGREAFINVPARAVHVCTHSTTLQICKDYSPEAGSPRGRWDNYQSACRAEAHGSIRQAPQTRLARRPPAELLRLDFSPACAAVVVVGYPSKRWVLMRADNVNQAAAKRADRLRRAPAARDLTRTAAPLSVDPTSLGGLCPTRMAQAIIFRIYQRKSPGTSSLS